MPEAHLNHTSNSEVVLTINKRSSTYTFAKNDRIPYDSRRLEDARS
jgi:hypothetical protein